MNECEVLHSEWFWVAPWGTKCIFRKTFCATVLTEVRRLWGPSSKRLDGPSTSRPLTGCILSDTSPLGHPLWRRGEGGGGGFDLGGLRAGPLTALGRLMCKR